jgi:hypothetical protein
MTCDSNEVFIEVHEWKKVYSSGEHNFSDVFFSILNTTVLTYNPK